jgi:hypothetical protein
MTTQRDDAQVESVVDEVRKIMVDLRVEQKAAVVIERLQELVAMEEASFDPASAPGRAH